MKLQPQTKHFYLLTLLIFISYISDAQTKLTVNGAKVNMANAVYLSANDVTVDNSGLLNVAGSTIKIAGNTTSSGSIDVRNGTAELNGTAAQQLAAGSFLGETVMALTINNIAGATVSDTLSITDVLTLANGTLATGGFMTLKSTSAGTARIAPVTSIAPVPISGNVIVERFIPPKRAFRFLTAPVNTTGSIRDNWMEGVNNPNTTSGNVNPVPNFGTHITGAGGNTNGFDPTYTNNPSFFTFNNASQAWVAATNTSTLLTAGTAYRIMVRGSRSTDLSTQTPPPTPTTLRATGTVVTGTVLMTKPGAGGSANMPELSSATDGYSFIANPYASPVNWLTLEKTDLKSTIYIFDPTLEGSNGRGQYVSYNGITGISNPSSQVDKNIQSGQAFFVQTAGPNPSLTFREQYKTGINRAVFRTPNEMPHLTLQLLLPGQESTGRSADGLAAYFSNDFDSSIGDEDSYKFTNQDENIAIVRNGKTLSIEGRKPVISNDTLPLKMWQLTLKNYMIKVDLSNFDTNVETFLEDSYLHTATKLNNNAVTMVPFSITTDTGSFAADRFKVVFTGSVTLAVPLAGMKAYVKNKGVQVEWITAFERNMDRYEVEKSANAQQFVTAGAVKAKVNAGTSSAYEWFDANPLNGDNYYRIKLVDKSGEAKYSSISKVNFETVEGISVVTNNGNGNTLTIAFKNIKKGKYSFSLVSNADQKVYSGSINHAGGSANRVIKLEHLLPSGVYHLQVSGNDKLKNIPVLIQ